MRRSRTAMMSVLKLSALAIVVSVGALGCKSVPPTPPHFRTDTAGVALATVSRGLGVEASRLTVAATSTAKLAYLNQSVSMFKVGDPKGNLHGVAVTSDLQPVDPAQILAEDHALRVRQLGTFDDALANEIERGGTQKLKVVIWVIEGASRAVDRPAAHGAALTREAIDAYYAATDKARAEALAKVVAPVLDRVRALDDGARADTLSPAISAELTPDQLRGLMHAPGIDRIYLDPPARQELDIAKSTSGVPVIHAAGILGTGVRVADVEALGGRPEPNSLLLRPFVQDGQNVCAAVDAHSTGVAAAIIERRLVTPPVGEEGFAPNAELRVGGSCTFLTDELRTAADRAATWGARAINLSWGLDTNRALGATDRFFDDLVFNRFRTVAKSAGNEACFPPNNLGAPGSGDGDVTSPGLAYNVITVGGYNDANTVTWAGDSVYPCSSFGNPISTHGDRQKPEIAAPAQDVTVVAPGPRNLQSANGTSIAAPQVVGTTALLIQNTSRLSIWPEIVRAVLMATATHNIEGDTRLSDIDGAGGFVASAAWDLLGDTQRWGGMTYQCDNSTASPLTLMTLSVGPRTRQRIVLSWDTDPAFDDYAMRPSVDIDLRVVDPNGRTISSSASWDNTYEIVEFDSWLANTYSVLAEKFRCDRSFTWLGWAWHTLPMMVRRMPGP